LNGAIFSGLVFGFENSIDQTTESEFRAILEIKTLASWNFYSVLKNETLDFICYFSSGQAYSFSGAAKLSAYAAGITFADSLVESLQENESIPIGIINWGFWSASVNMIREKNIDVSIENLYALDDEKGFDCFEQFVNALEKGRLRHVLCMNISPQMESLVRQSRNEIFIMTEKQGFELKKSKGESIEIPHEVIRDIRTTDVRNKLDADLAEALYGVIYAMVASSRLSNPTIENLRGFCEIIDKYSAWWRECFHFLKDYGFIKLDSSEVTSWTSVDTKESWKKWQAQKEQYLKRKEYSAVAKLVNDCLYRLPDILKGHVLATDVIFPNSSMEKVEKIYKNNTRGDMYNEIVANAVVAYVKENVSCGLKEGIRILEIGAGTGGTSEIVFEKLRPYSSYIDEYLYTDLSQAFFFHAENKFVRKYSYIRCKRLDIENHPASQGIDIAAYDIVLATNVLHATKDIRKTIRNAHAALKHNGYLILNEMSDKSPTTHLTFGLLDGWWLFTDPENRIPNCPGLYPPSWEALLKEEGFPHTYTPVKNIEDLGQQIIIGQSDGIIRLPLITAEEINRVKNEAEPKKITIKERKNIKPTAKQPREINEYVKETLCESLCDTLKIHRNTIDMETAFADYGIDSILGAGFIDQINAALCIDLNTAVLFEHASIIKLRDHITNTYSERINESVINHHLSKKYAKEEITKADNALGKHSTAISPSSRRIFSRSKTTQVMKNGQCWKGDDDIAVVGMSGMFPKADNVRRFWRNLVQGVDGIQELPANYLNREKYFATEKTPGKTRCKWGGILSERDCFDPLFFNISPRDAESMNPHQRLVLQESWKAIEDAGYNPRALSDTHTGIFIGAEPTGYRGKTFTGYSEAIVASRLSYALDLRGPAFVVNTGCSSSGVAIHLACESLRKKETDMSLAGGINACMDHNVQIRLDEIEMISPSGRCFTFDEAGDGTIISEGVGIIVLKRLDDAIAAGDTIYGIICGSGTNQDGASNGITAPNGAAQEELIKKVYKTYNINPENISYVEAHGTGTKLGDPVEVNALI
ncbi:MAG: methyltransferase, partial [Chitinivibrionales bacterium]|nr:methyltransferase [Chitinivibrionales bacterium]